MTDRLIPYREFCKENAFSLTTAHKLARNGQLQLVKVGGRTFIRASDAAAFVSNRPAAGKRELPSDKS